MTHFSTTKKSAASILKTDLTPAFAAAWRWARLAWLTLALASALAAYLMFQHAGSSLDAFDWIGRFAALFAVALASAVWPTMWPAAWRIGKPYAVKAWGWLNAAEDRKLAPKVSPMGWALSSSLIRFVAALNVVAAHIMQGGVTFANMTLLNWVNSLGAINIFLVISGFSIAASIDREPEGFNRRRRWRILPVWWASMAISIAICAHFHAPASSPVDYLGAALFIGIFAAHAVPGAIAPGWTLACEECYYFVAPILKKLTTRLLAVLAVVSAVAQGSYSLLNSGATFPHNGPICVLGTWWPWLLGFLLWRHKLPITKQQASGLLIGLTIGVLAGGVPLFVLALAAIATVHLLEMQDIPKLRKLCTYLGDISFPLYVSHFAVIFGFRTMFGYALDGSLSIIASLAVAVAIYHLIDLPTRRLRDWVASKPLILDVASTRSGA